MPWPITVCLVVLLLILVILSLRVRVILTARSTVKLEYRILFYRKEIPLRRNPNKKKKHYKKQKAITGIKGLDNLIDDASLREELRLVRGLLSLIVRRKKRWLRLHMARLHIRVATGDAATTAVAYGAVAQSVSYLLAALDRVIRVRAREPEVSVQADFVGERSSLDVRIVLSLHVWDVLFAELRMLAIDQNKKKATAAKNAADRTKGASS